MRRVTLCLFVATIAMAQDRIGPLSGMRIPVWDWTQPSADKYLYMVPAGDAINVQRSADGLYWEFRILAAPGTGVDGRTIQILAGSGLLLRTPFAGQAARLEFDATYVVHVAGTGAADEPADRSPCYNGVGEWRSRAAISYCVPTTDDPRGPWEWRRVPLPE